MTEEACKAIDCLYEGNPVECSTDAYHSEIRNALILFSLDCAYSNDADRMQVALAEVSRLDNEHGYGMSLEIRRQGGKTDQARGARRQLYFVTEKYRSKEQSGSM